jgi:hypothetical protein
MLNQVLRVTLALSMLSCAAFAADISGAWQFTLETPKGKGSPSFEFKQDGEKLSGTYSGKFGKAALSGTVKGDQVEFFFDGPNAAGKFHYTGTVDGPASMKGAYELEGSEKGTFAAAKK